MSELEVLRIAGEILALAGVLFTAVWRLTRVLVALGQKLDGLSGRLDEMNGSVERVDKRLIDLDAGANRQLEVNAWVAGRLGENMPKKQEPI